jgi:hypothetical protein
MFAYMAGAGKGKTIPKLRDENRNKESVPLAARLRDWIVGAGKERVNVENFCSVDFYIGCEFFRRNDLQKEKRRGPFCRARGRTNPIVSLDATPPFSPRL